LADLLSNSEFNSSLVRLSPNICGDHWINPDEVQSDLDNIAEIYDPETPILLKIDSEGPSLGALGLADMLLKHCEKTGRSPDTIQIQGWFNEVEKLPFTKIDRFFYSHFLWMSKNYWKHETQEDTRERRIGFFMGRRTLPRKLMLYNLWWMDFSSGRKDFLLSLMKQTVPIPTQGVNLDDPIEWLKDTPSDEFRAWWNSPPIGSLDFAAVSDQYSIAFNTNLSILKFYHKFGLELVSESYCHGETFFMTEKTIRPMVGLKPMLIYGPKKYLQRMREIGFQTWGDLWDESYDDLSGYDRWCKIKNQIKTFVSMSDDDFWNAMDRSKEICQHNIKHLKKLVLENSPR
jgi:hypothetical protein